MPKVLAMSAYRMTDLCCDGEGCEVAEQHVGTAVLARSKMIQAGWVHRYGLDYCTECVAKGRAGPEPRRRNHGKHGRRAPSQDGAF